MPEQTVEKVNQEVAKTESTSQGKELAVVNEKQLEVQKTLDAVASGDEHVNAFTAIAMMLKQMRSDLEGVKRTGQLPRWMRVARVREFKGEGAMNLIASKGVIPITGGFLKVIGFLAELALKAQELLTQADGGKALLEVGAGMIKTVASDPFFEAVTETVGIESPGANPLKPIGPIVDTAMKIIDKIPDPEDVEIIAKEIYLLLAVEQLELVFDATGKVDIAKIGKEEVVHINPDQTGKARLMAWALEKGIPFHGLSGGIEVIKLGSRRVWESTTDLPEKSVLMSSHDNEEIKILEFYFGTDTGKSTANTGTEVSTGVAGPSLNDIQEANAILTKLGYPKDTGMDESVFNAAFAKRLRQFQKMNKLDVNAQLDNNTINRLMNLDFVNKKLKRAKKYDENALSDFDSTKNEVTKVPAKKESAKKSVR